jgi:hypothetical protein
MTAERAVRRSISHNECAVLALHEDLAASDRIDAGLEELQAFGLEDSVEENDGTVDAWGTHDGNQWRVKLVDGIAHGIQRYV